MKAWRQKANQERARKDYIKGIEALVERGLLDARQARHMLDHAAGYYGRATKVRFGRMTKVLTNQRTLAGRDALPPHWRWLLNRLQEVV